ncbi:MAG: guanylate kinase [Planctomycetota bacterium]
MMAEATKGKLAVLSGPSGVGKSTLIKRLLEDDRFALSTSATTREPREGELNGREYHFHTLCEFQTLIDANEFLEWAIVHGHHRYGTLKSEVNRLVEAGKIVILDIDVQGALKLEEREDLVRVFIAPPRFEDLEVRLRSRASETESSIETRLVTARHELTLQDEYDHVVVNDEVEKTVDALKSVLLKAKENLR